jgi:RNA polymerase sigma-70 factor (ECF subfamily)
MPAAPPSSRDASIFERYRPRIFGIAYRMLGSFEDAEDAVQEAYLRWHGAAAEQIVSTEAWLVSVVTRIAIDRLRLASTRREEYVGTWLPEPVATDPATAPDHPVELSSDLSMAFLVLLERLAPEERAAFLLRELFDAGYDEIASVLEKSEAACRQIVHRARERVRRDAPRNPVPPDAKERLVERFVSALAAEDRDGLLSLFSDDVVWMSDGGGKVQAVPKVIAGAERVVKMAVGFQRQGRGLVTHRITSINGEAAVLTLVDGRTLFTTSLAVDGDRITAIYRVLNPDKLRRVGPPPYQAGSGL